MKKNFLSFLLLSFSINANAANLAYVEVNSNKLENAGCYIDSKTKQPFFQLASIFAANINGNDPNAPVIFLNPQVTSTLLSSQVQHLQQKGIKVLVSLLGNHQNAGWACMTSSAAAEKFADQVVSFVNKYGIDGIDIDDEYSKCSTNDYSMIMMAKAIKSHPGFKGKLLTKALYTDYRYFQSSYQGHKLSEYLDYGWEMTYSDSDYMGRLKPYVRAGLPLSQLMVGAHTERTYPDPYEIGKFTAKHELAGLMVFNVNNHSASYLRELQKGFNNGQASVDVLPQCLE